EFWVDSIRWYEGDYVEPVLESKFIARNPIPEDGSLKADFQMGVLGTSLAWTAGTTAATHDVYFGENYDDVAAGTGGTFRDNLLGAVTYFLVGYGYTTNDPLPGGFVPGTTYYWRIDEIEAERHIPPVRLMGLNL
ncbi:MAG: hypothetical protein ACYTFW_11305, partial [Planctomycetota bacterium]